ncbi:SDR family NAD(P)-dependent oxidoreductase [Xanthomarina sp. F1114]|uniref:SDR family NAD(P)-dependent oxidoreductase n=1 Tax=Xanthomarina sp. F1114 TaxID=2996019 RepID=UPI00225E441F|nr:SDR family oxidoreductase [Xanthomarina sp. F1114]MCX7548871.1 SDR family NAD(P)-dependent oxidoreductase [Xanthomarina sp. F1114]
MNPFTLKGKTVLITGASSGIGEATAIACDQLGARLLILGRNEERLLGTLKKLSANDHRTLTIDLTDFESLEKEIPVFLKEVNSIEGIVHAAGITSTYPFKLFKPTQLDTILKVNVQTAFYLTKLVLTKLNKQGASIIFISSIMASVGEKAKTMYAMSKGAVSAGAKSLAIEYASRNVRVNSIAPGIVNTPMTANATYKKNETLHAETLAQYPLGFGNPEDIAYSCVYLLSDASKWVTGTEIVIDGGYSAK